MMIVKPILILLQALKIAFLAAGGEYNAVTE
jgi:hypothetical protein